VFFHLGGKFLERDFSVTIVIHLFKEEVYLLFDDSRVNDLQKLRKLVEVKFMIWLQAHAVQKFVKINVFGVDLKPKLRHHHL